MDPGECSRTREHVTPIDVQCLASICEFAVLTSHSFQSSIIIFNVSKRCFHWLQVRMFVTFVFWRIRSHSRATAGQHLAVKLTFNSRVPSSVQSRPTFRRNTSIFSRSLLATCFHAGFFLDLFFDPEDGGDMLLRNVGWLSTDYTALYPRRYVSQPYGPSRPVTG
jgi:hypothetical protein